MARARRRWGQHWLANDALAAKLVRLVDPVAGDTFLEIGPGRGRLTAALLRREVRVVAVEVDPECCAALERLGSDRLRVVEADVLEIDLADLVESPTRVVGNLPYYISSPILGWSCAHRELVRDAHYMLPAEVAERVAAEPGGRVYGALSVRLQWDFDVELLLRLPPGAFRPPPTIDSAFVALRPRPGPGSPLDDERLQLVHDAFAHRRKTLPNALAGRGWDKDRVRDACRRAGISPGVRAEALGPRDFDRLAAALVEEGA